MGKVKTEGQRDDAVAEGGSEGIWSGNGPRGRGTVRPQRPGPPGVRPGFGAVTAQVQRGRAQAAPGGGAGAGAGHAAGQDSVLGGPRRPGRRGLEHLRARGRQAPLCRQLHLRPRTLKVSFSLDNGDCRACTPEGLCTWSEARPGPPIGTGGPGAREELEDRLQPFIWFVLKEVGDGVRCAVSGCLSQ